VAGSPEVDSKKYISKKYSKTSNFGVYIKYKMFSIKTAKESRT